MSKNGVFRLKKRFYSKRQKVKGKGAESLCDADYWQMVVSGRQWSPEACQWSSQVRQWSSQVATGRQIFGMDFNLSI